MLYACCTLNPRRIKIPEFRLEPCTKEREKYSGRVVDHNGAAYKKIGQEFVTDFTVFNYIRSCNDGDSLLHKLSYSTPVLV